MLADEVRLELVNKLRLQGSSEVGRYFNNYARIKDWHFVAGLVERRPAILVRAPGDPSVKPEYFVLLSWAGDKVVNIRDFRFACYATEGADMQVIS